MIYLFAFCRAGFFVSYRNWGVLIRLKEELGNKYNLGLFWGFIRSVVVYNVSLSKLNLFILNMKII